MNGRIYEELDVILKKKNVVRLLEYKEGGKEYTEINVYNKDAKIIKGEKDSDDNFVFGFTLKGKGEEFKESIDKMDEGEFEKFIKKMTTFIEKKYNIVPVKVKKDKKKKTEKTDEISDFELPDLPSL